jgi:hypothetical protein
MAEFVALFQIGEDRYGYKYGSTKMRANSAPVYQCIRGTDQNCVVNCLWLYRSSDGHWIAIEAPKTSLGPITEGDPTFRTLDPVEDIHVRQQLQWQYCKPQTWEWEGSMTFTTYPMADPPPMISAHRDLLAAALPGSTAAGNANLATVPETAAISDITESQQDDVQ